MLKHLPCVHMETTSFRAQPISSDMDEKAVRFELERRACQSLRKVLQLKLQQRRTREELVNQGIIPPLKSSASFHEHKRSLERARTEDYLKRKIQRRPERAELIRMHILDEASSEASVQAQQWQLKRTRLADNLNDKISQRPGPMELIQKNILPVHSNVKHVIIDTEFSKASDELSSCDEDSNDSQDSPLPPGALTLTQARSPVQDPTDSPVRLTTSLSTCAQRITAENKSKIHSPEHNIQKQKKLKDDKPKIKKLKYHEYIPPDQKGDKEAPPKLDSSYAKLLQQQQLFLQLQILSQQHRQQSVRHPSIPTQSDKQTDQAQSSLTSELPVDAAVVPSNSQTEEINRATCLPSNLDELKVAELKAELKSRGLTVSGTKSDLIERLRAHQAGSAGRGSTCSQAAGGAKEPGPEGASRTAANGSLSLQLSSLVGQAATTQRTSTFQIRSSEDNSSNASLTVPEDSILITGPKQPKTQEALGETLDQQPASTPQLSISIKEEQTSPLPAALCQFSLQPVYIDKCCAAQKDSSKPKAQEDTVDKDLMLQQKDQQIEELKRLLVHNQRLVEMFRTKLERKRRGELQHETETMLLLRVKEEPPDKTCKTEKPPTLMSVGELAVTVKQEVVEEVSVQTLTAGPRVRPELPNGHVDQNVRQQQAVHRLLFQQQRRLQNQATQSHDHRVECRDKQQKACLPQEKKKKKSHRQQQRPVFDVQQHHHQQIQLKQQALLQQQKALSQQQSKECQQTQIQSRIEQPQPKQKTPQVSAVCPDQKLQHMLSFDLHNNSTPAIVTDSNGNHFLITLTNQITESQANGKTSKHLTLQRLQSSAAKLPGHGSAQLPRPDNEANAIMLRGGLKQQSSKDQSGLEQSRAEPHQELSQNLCDESMASPPPTLNKMCSSLDFLFSPVSPAASSSDAKDTENEDFLDFILKTGDISRFKPSPDPALDSLHRSSSPLQPLLSPATAPCLDPAPPAPSAAPHKSAGAPERNRAGRLEDFLESTTGTPLLGVEPGGPLTLIDDLHSQMLCTQSILDHPPSSPMDAMDAEPSASSEEEHGVDGMDWLDLTMEESHRKDLPKLATPTPPSVFSTDFLDNYDLETAWDSCL